MAAKRKTAKRSSRSKKKKPSGSAGVKLWLWAVAIGVTAVSLLLVLRLPPRTVPEQPAEHGSAPKRETVAQGQQGEPSELTKRVSVESATKAYEEALDAELEQLIKEADLAIVQSLVVSGIGADNLRHREVNLRITNGQEYHFQSLALQISTAEKNEAFLSQLRDYLNRWLGQQARLVKAEDGAAAWTIEINNLKTHRIELIDRFKSSPEPGLRPKIAVVIDDMGESVAKARRLTDIFGSGCTLSILPQSSYSGETARVARKRGADILLHLPMEPVSYPAADPGPGALFVDMERTRIQSILRRSIQGLPGIIGVNNHMGSRFTADERCMRIVLTTLKEQGLFFMDSLTSSSSLAAKMANRMNVQTISRDIFIDNQRDVESILFQLQKAEQVAREKGYAVVIGHPYPETLDALEHWVMKNDGAIQLCGLSQLMRRSAQAHTSY